ncbi:hypothetical protein D039_0074B, partial [Vibrio parahaemolyticus EKP-028]
RMMYSDKHSGSIDRTGRDCKNSERRKIFRASRQLPSIKINNHFLLLPSVRCKCSVCNPSSNRSG